MFSWIKKFRRDNTINKISYYYENGFYDECIELCLNLWKTESINTNTIIVHSLCHINSGNSELALEVIDNGLKLNSQNPELISQKIYYLYTNNQIEKAFDLSSIQIKNYPQNEDNLQTHAWILGLMGKVEDSVSCYKKILSLDLFKDNFEYNDSNLIDDNFNSSTNVDALNNLGYQRMKIGQYNEAIENFNRVIELNKYHSFSFNNLGFAYLKNGQIEKAILNINHSLELNEENSYAYKNKALYYLELNNKAKALENLEIAKELNFEEFYGEEVNQLIVKIKNGA